jgi:hypothetical protein
VRVAQQKTAGTLIDLVRARLRVSTAKTGPEPSISLEGAKAGPRPGFDSCPRATELGTTQGVPVHGQGSSHALEAPQDIFEAKGGGPRRNPPGGGIEPSNPIEGNRDPHDHFLASLRASLGH